MESECKYIPQFTGIGLSVQSIRKESASGRNKGQGSVGHRFPGEKDKNVKAELMNLWDEIERTKMSRDQDRHFRTSLDRDMYAQGSDQQALSTIVKIL